MNNSVSVSEYKNISDKFEQNEEIFDIKKIIGVLLVNWHLFLIGLLLAGSICFLFIRYSTPVYLVNAQLLIEEDQSAGSALATGGSQIFSDLGGLFGATNNVDNEVAILKTNTLLDKVVKDLQLNVSYFNKGTIKNIELFNQAPFTVHLVTSPDTLEKPIALFWREKSPNKYNLLYQNNGVAVAANYGDTVKMRSCSFYLTRDPDMTIKKDDPKNLFFTIDGSRNTLTLLEENLTVDIPQKEATLIQLALNTRVQSKGETIMITFIRKYMEYSLDQKNKIADSTLSFVNNRLILVSSELSAIENQVSKYKGNNKLLDAAVQGQLLAETADDNFKQASQLDIQLDIIRGLKDYLKDENNNKRVIPSNLLVTNPTFIELVSRYNTIMVERDRVSLNYTETNPILQNLDLQAVNLRKDMANNLLVQERSLIQSKEKLNGTNRLLNSKIAGSPNIEMGYLQLAREQKIKEALYLYLVQKREEVAISKSSTTPKATVIEIPKAEIYPISPNKPIIIFIAAFLGLVLPAAYLILKSLLNNKITTKNDVVRKTNVNILSELSHVTDKEKNDKNMAARSIIAEQFRSLRTNLQFLLGTDDKKIMMITSSVSGEGKSFISLNLSAILSYTDKRVVLLEMDLRKPKIRAYLKINHKLGFTDYIVNKNVSIDDIIIPAGGDNKYFIIPSGSVPPNPSELLLNSKTALLFEELKKRFDYIIVDSPPIGVVTDAQILSPLVDLTLYVVRQNFTFKFYIDILQEIYENDKLKNLYLIVNDVKAGDQYGYGYGGYNYAYSSHYNYYGNEVKENSKLGKAKKFLGGLFSDGKNKES